jgi:hypothetical protein
VLSTDPRTVAASSGHRAAAPPCSEPASPAVVRRAPISGKGSPASYLAGGRRDSPPSTAGASRKWRPVGLIEAICAAARKGRIYPLLSQCKFVDDSLWSASPALEEAFAASAVLDKAVAGLHTEAGRCLKVLAEAADDAVLRNDLGARKENDSLIPDVSVVGDREQREAVLLIAIGQPLPVLFAFAPVPNWNNWKSRGSKASKRHYFPLSGAVPLAARVQGVGAGKWLRGVSRQAQVPRWSTQLRSRQAQQSSAGGSPLACNSSGQ